MLEDRNCTELTQGPVASKDRVILGGIAAVESSETVRAGVVRARVKAGGRMGRVELDGAGCEL